MQKREILVSMSFVEHNKQFYIDKEKHDQEQEKILRKGCTCDFWTLEAQNLRELKKIYWHAKSCPKFKK